MARIFISCVSGEFGAYRVELAKYFRRADCDVRVQEDFAQVPEDTIQKLDAYIRNCDAVVHILGKGCGAFADDAAVAAYLSEEPEFLEAMKQVGDFKKLKLSYTQWEAFLAAYHGKSLFVYQATKPITDGHPTRASGFDVDWPPFEPKPGDDELIAQHCERLKVMPTRRYTSPFRDLVDICGQFIGDLHKIIGVRKHTATQGATEFRAYHPQKVPAYFSGRHEELRQLDERLKAASPSVVVVIGFGGQGKSTLVDHWRREQQAHLFAVGFGCTADLGGFNFEDFLDECLKHLMGENFKKQEMVSVEERRHKLIELLRSGKTLVIIDGVERWLRGWKRELQGSKLDVELDPRDRNGAYEGLDTFLEEMTSLNNGTHLVLTTRALPVVLENAEFAAVPVDEEGKHISLEGLSDADAVALLRSIGVDGADAKIAAAAKYYGNHPLAVSILGRVLVNRHGGKVDGIERFRLFDQRHAKGKEQIFHLFSEMSKRLPRGEADRLFLQVASLCIEDAGILTILAGLGLEGIPDSVKLDDAIDQAVDLASWGLVYWDGARQKVGLHALVKQHFGSEIDNQTNIHTRLSLWYASQELPGRAVSLEDVRFRFLAIEHAAKACNFKQCADLTLSQINNDYTLVEWLAAWGHLSQGQDLLARIGDIAPASERAVFVISRSVLLRELGRLDESIAILDQLISEQGSQTGSDSDSNRLVLAKARANRANSIWQSGDFTTALREYEASLQVLEALVLSGVASFTDVAKLRANRANALLSAGRLHQALDDSAKALAIFRFLDLQGDAKVAPEIASALTNRAITLGALREYPAARKTLESGLDIYERLITSGRGEFYPQLAYVQAMLGSTLSEAGDSGSAVTVLTKAEASVGGFIQLGRTDLEWMHALILLNRGIAYQRLAQSNSALMDLNRAIVIFAELEQGGRHDVGGWLAYCFMTRSEAKYALSDYSGAESDREHGFQKADDYVENGHPRVHLPLFRRVIAAAVYQPDANVTKWLSRVLLRTERFLDDEFGNEHLLLVVKHLLPRLETALPRLESQGFQTEMFFRLKRRIEPT